MNRRVIIYPLRIICFCSVKSWFELLFSSSIGSHAEINLWRKEHSVYLKEILAWLILMWISSVLIPPTILASILLQEFRFLKSLPSLMHLQSREKDKCKMPRKPDLAKRKRPLARPCCGGERTNRASCCGDRGRFWEHKCTKALLKFCTYLSLQPDVFFILVSGKTGTALGGPVRYSTNGEGKVIGPQVHITSRGAIYILFGFGKMHLASPALHLTEKNPFYLKWPRASLGYFDYAFCCKS